MVCPNCGEEVEGKFCPNCGTKLIDIEPNKVSGKTVQMKCMSCGGIMDVDPNKSVMVCPYCGSKELILESDEVTIERIRNATYKDIEHEKMSFEQAKYNDRKQEKKTTSFKSGKLSKFIIICIVIDALGMAVAFNDVRPVAGVIAILQLALLVMAWLMGAGTIKEKLQGQYVLFAIVGMVLTIPYMSFYNGRGAEALESRKDNDNYTATTSSSSEEKVDYNKKYTWPQNGLLTKLSKPSSQFGEVSYSEDDEANAIIYQVSEDDYQKYVQECKKKGFTEYADSSTEEYEAWNKNNDFLELSYDSDKSTYSISVTAQHEMKDISWPKGQLAKSLPTPKKLHGYIAEDSSDSLSIYIDNVSEKDFNTYVDDCLDKGYDSDYYRYDDSFHGTNNKHEKRDLSVEWERNKVMHIYLMDWEL